MKLSLTRYIEEEWLPSIRATVRPATFKICCDLFLAYIKPSFGASAARQRHAEPSQQLLRGRVPHHGHLREHARDPIPVARALAAQMSQAWVNFARAGDPNRSGLPMWPADSPDERSTMIFDDPCEVVTDPFREERLVVEGN